VIRPKCNAKIKLAKCANHNIANVILEDDTKKVYCTTTFNDVLEKIRSFTTGEHNLDNQLLAAPPLIYTINHKEIVSSVAMELN